MVTYMSSRRQSMSAKDSPTRSKTSNLIYCIKREIVQILLRCWGLAVKMFLIPTTFTQCL